MARRCSPGILLVVVGLLSLASGAITYTSREEVLDVGLVEVTTEKHERIRLPPVLDIVSVIAATWSVDVRPTADLAHRV